MHGVDAVGVPLAVATAIVLAAVVAAAAAWPRPPSPDEEWRAFTAAFPKLTVHLCPFGHQHPTSASAAWCEDVWRDGEARRFFADVTRWHDAIPD